MGAWLDNLVLILIATLILIIFWWSMYAFFYAIFLFVFSAGDAEKIKTAWNSIRYMILWVLFTISLLFVFPVIFKNIWLVNAEMFSAQSILRMAVDIVNYLFSFWSETIRVYQSWWAIWPTTITAPGAGAAWSLWWAAPASWGFEL